MRVSASKQIICIGGVRPIEPVAASVGGTTARRRRVPAQQVSRRADTSHAPCHASAAPHACHSAIATELQCDTEMRPRGLRADESLKNEWRQRYASAASTPAARARIKRIA